MEKGTALVCGAGGFIGSHLAKRLQEEGIVSTSQDGNKGSKVLIHDDAISTSLNDDII